LKKTATDEFRLLGNISNILACISQVFTTSGYPADLQLAAAEVKAAVCQCASVYVASSIFVLRVCEM